MAPLVSILIPCYNAERWVGEAIESGLAQTYSPVEIIVVDDGSTDGSLEVIKSFGQKIQWETGPNRGGNHARNRALARSKGEYIQYLDADDYLLPEKIERHVKALQKSGAGLVYEDWQRFVEESDGGRTWFPVIVTGKQADVLESLLSGWVPALQAFLFQREVFMQVGGWDESFTTSQDWELEIRLAMAGVIFEYQPGCHSAVRRPATVPTVSNLSHDRNNRNVERILKAAEAKLTAEGRLTDNHKRGMARNYFKQARNYFDTDRARFQFLLSEAERLSDNHVVHESQVYKMIAKLFGVMAAERFCVFKRRLRGRWNV